MEIVRPQWHHFEDLVASAKEDLLVCSPFYSGEGIGRLFDSFDAGTTRLRFWTRLSPPDWLDRSTDPEQLLALIETLEEQGTVVEFGVIQRLHAKVYAADSRLAMIGSANLSTAGFDRSLELMAVLTDEDASDLVQAAEALCAAEKHVMTSADLHEWVESSRDDIERAREDQPPVSEGVVAAQKRLDQMLGLGKSSGQPATPGLDDLNGFIAWLEQNPEFPGAAVVTERYAGYQSLQGHVKQCFFGISRYLAEYPAQRDGLAGKLGVPPPNEIYPLDEQVLDTWIAHLDGHAMDEGAEFSYSTLRVILPPSLGGTCTNGGGASGTLKRMLPLVAEYLRSR